MENVVVLSIRKYEALKIDADKYREGIPTEIYKEMQGTSGIRIYTDKEATAKIVEKLGKAETRVKHTSKRIATLEKAIHALSGTEKPKSFKLGKRAICNDSELTELLGVIKAVCDLV